MMRFKDFAIHKKNKPQEQEEVGEVLLRINKWVEENEYGVLNIETLFFPNLHMNKWSTGARFFTVSEHAQATYQFQVFRVWYQTGKSVNEIDVDMLI